MLTYHPLTIAELRPEGERRRVCITLEVPRRAARGVSLRAGQHIGVRAHDRRRGSAAHVLDLQCARASVICASACVCTSAAACRGHLLGHASRRRHARSADADRALLRRRSTPQARAAYCAFAAAAASRRFSASCSNVLRQEPDSRFMLFYGNRTTATIMFAEDLLALKDRYPAAPVAVLPHEPRAAGHRAVQWPARCAQGRACSAAGRCSMPRGVDAYFLCGPGTMIDDVRARAW